ncbi:hypothetical protein D9758_006287 [Tetrapyrgos nigripes]|uniref:BTB domain-containing protein n=1 Tax=Tetrapyrgos nigripes TaxID=182062 RepID=A0A8H5D8J3_9AGAR|nr:hypothetical protein D9758_006287 [Tetrapyrgos nigripes]
MAATKTSFPKTDVSYYWETVVFLVEDTVFKIPKYHFAKSSEVFESMFSLPQGDKEAEGNTDANPIRLEGIQAIDFRRFLKVLYPSQIPWREDETTMDEWKSILKLATLWRFLTLRKFAIDKLTSQEMDVTERILMGREFSVSSWIKSGYSDLVSQDGPLSMETAKSIGYEAAVRVFRAREAASRNNLKAYTNRRHGADLGRYVETEFADELSRASKDGAVYQQEEEETSSMQSPDRRCKVVLPWSSDSDDSA